MPDLIHQIQAKTCFSACYLICTIGWNVTKFASLYKSDRINSLLDFGYLDLIFKVTAKFMTKIATIDWFGCSGTTIFSENTAIFSILLPYSNAHIRWCSFKNAPKWSAAISVKPHVSQWKATLCDDVRFPTVYCRFTAASFWHFPIRHHVTFTSALELGLKVYHQDSKL